MKYGIAHAARTIPLKQKTKYFESRTEILLFKSYFDKHYNLDMYFCM